MSETLLSVRDLKVSYRVGNDSVNAVDGASFDVPRGCIVGLVGESGCGKTTVARALTRVMADNASITGGQMVFDGRNLVTLPERDMNALRWRDIAFIPQSAMNSLDPVYTVEYQLNEVLRRRGGLGRRQARARCEELFEMVGIEVGRLRDYPHQFSGGMRQRGMIAMALACNPKLIIADEPTTALDVTVQAQILDLLKDLASNSNTALILITHDLGVVARYADRVAVMYGGRIVEMGPARELYANPKHPYTRGLMASVPRIDGDTSRPLIPIDGQPPDLAALPEGCAFMPRCKQATEQCRTTRPSLRQVGELHFKACLIDD